MNVLLKILTFFPLLPVMLIPLYFFPQAMFLLVVTVCLLAVTFLAVLSLFNPAQDAEAVDSTAKSKTPERRANRNKSSAVASSNVISNNLLRLNSKLKGAGRRVSSDQLQSEQQIRPEAKTVDSVRSISPVDTPGVMPLVDDTSGVRSGSTCSPNSQLPSEMTAAAPQLRPSPDSRTRTPDVMHSCNLPDTLMPPTLEPSVSVDKEVEAFCQFLKKSQTTRKKKPKMRLRLSKSDLEAMKNSSKEAKKTSPLRPVTSKRPRPQVSPASSV